MKMKRIAAGILAFTLLMSCAVTTWAEGVGMYVTIPYLGSSENPTRYDLMYFIGSTFYYLDQRNEAQFFGNQMGRFHDFRNRNRLRHDHQNPAGQRQQELLRGRYMPRNGNF